LGHYVVVFAADEVEKSVGYLDPAISTGSVWVSAATFDAARKSEGTDEDIILCYRKTV
jgi:hypothetical protein